MVSDLQGYHKGIVVGLDHPYNFLAGKSDSLGSYFNLLQLIGIIHLSTGSLLGNLNVWLSRPIQSPQMPWSTNDSVNVLHKQLG